MQETVLRFLERKNILVIELGCYAFKICLSSLELFEFCFRSSDNLFIG